MKNTIVFWRVAIIHIDSQVAPAVAQFNPVAMSYTMPTTTTVQQQYPNFVPTIQTYSTYPQVQETSVSTPISLPGMPPITVNTSIPVQALEGIQYTNSN
jgi:hypothetical protein